MAQAARTAVILLVDDDEPGRCAHARILRGAGYEVREAATGAQALELLAQDTPDLAILDIRLPGASGSEVLRRIRTDPATAALPAMYLSATYADEASIAQGLTEGADAYLTKPVAPAVLLGQVAALLRVGRVNKELLAARPAAEEAEQAQQALRESEARLNEILSSIQDGFFELDREWRYTYINPRAARNGGFEPEQLLGRSIWEAFPYLVGTEFEAVYREVMDTRRPRQFEVKSVIRDQWYQISMYPSAAGISGFWTDITARVQAEEALRQTEMELREAQRVARVGSWYWNAETDAVTVSEQIYRMLGLDPALPISTLREWEWRLYTPESQERVRDAVQTALQTGAGYTLEVEAQRVDGTPLWIAARAEVVRGAGGRIVGLRGTNQDITDYKQAEQSAIAAERARAEIAEHMGDEIDHRVKNNLAMVSGLLQMQLLREQDPHIAGALRDAIGRIRTFVTLHEQMYAARTEEADLLVAVQRIAATMGELFAARDDVAINVRGDPFRCSARVATNLSVATSELVTNALKHGGPGADGRRTVAISLHPAEETVTLSVWNSGNPIPNSIDPARSQTLGLRLVHDVVVGRYGGGFRLYPSDGGTLAEVVVPGEAMRADSAPR